MTNPLPTNPGADPAVQPPDFINWFPLDADVNLLGQKTNCYVIHGANGVWIVDPPSSRTNDLTTILEAAKGNIAGIWLTHTHPDHIAGVLPLVAQNDVPVYAHPRARETLGDSFQWIDVQEGSTIDGWKVYELPGHRYDSVGFVHEATKAGIVGDLVSGAGSIIVDSTDGDLFDYMASLYRLRDEIQTSLILAGHGPLSNQPQVLLTHFIEHRLKREKMVVDALTPTPQTLAELLPVTYADTSPTLYPLAERALLTILLKLQREHRAVQDASGWRLA